MNQQNLYDECWGKMSSYDDKSESYSGDFVCQLSPDAKYPRIKRLFLILVYGLRNDQIY